MPAVHDGSLREVLFKDRAFTDEFDPIGGLFFGQCAEYCGNSHAYMQFRAMAQTDADFDMWVKRFQSLQAKKAPEEYDPEKEYKAGDIVLLKDPSLGKKADREWQAEVDVDKGQAPGMSSKTWKKKNQDGYEMGRNHFLADMCNQCHAVNRTGLGEKGPNLTLFGLRTSLAAGWRRNDRKNLTDWLRNSEKIKFGNLMWNDKSVINFEPTKEQKEDGINQHPVRELKNDSKRIEQLATYLLGQS